jgi:hypothetical protein
VLFLEHLGENYPHIFDVPTFIEGDIDKHFVVIDDTYEGLLTQYKIDEAADYLRKYGVKFAFVSSNEKLIGKDVYHYNFNLIYKMFDGINVADENKPPNLKTRDKKFLCLNRQIRFHRLLTVDYLLKSDLLEHSYISCGKAGLDVSASYIDNIDPYIKQRCEVNPILDYDIIQKTLDRETFKRLDKFLPLECDITESESNINTAHLPNPRQLFDQSYWSIITERDFFNQDYLGFTEKVLKAFLFNHPFVVVGLPFTLKKLQDLGFITFSSAVNEDYDKEEDPDKRFDLVKKEIDRLANLNYAEHWNLYNQLRPILDHNRKHFIAINSQKRPTRIINRLLEWYHYGK